MLYVEIDDNVNDSVDDGPTPSIVQPQSIDQQERRKQRRRERYAEMTADKKNEIKSLQSEAYQRRKTLAGKYSLSINICNDVCMVYHHQHELLLLYIR